jgi:2-keto-3-deoxy-L-fuconate dehydrogenase
MTARLQGKMAFVTAAAQGIGRATALAFAAEGAIVHATDLNAAKLADLAGPNLHVAGLDVLDPAAIATIAKSVGPIDILFNCAGFVHQGNVLDATEAEWDFAFNLNARSMFRTISTFLPGMVERGQGSIVNIASVASSVKGIPNRFIYGTSKAAVVGLTKSVAADFVQEKIRCNSVPARCSPRASTTASPPTPRPRARSRLPVPPSSPARRWAGSAPLRKSPCWLSISPATKRNSSPARPSSSTAAYRFNRSFTECFRPLGDATFGHHGFNRETTP